jgi:opacity protein-like surface antigen
MRNFRILPSLILLFLLTFSWAFAQNAPPRLDVFVEGAGSFLNGSSGTTVPGYACPAGQIPPCPIPSAVAVTSSFSKAVRLFAGGRFRFTRHDALEASYAYSPNHFSFLESGQATLPGYSRADLLSCNYVRYLWTKTSVQPFVTGGVGGNRFSGPAGISGFFNADNGWQFAWNFGAGADIVLQRHFAVRMELRDYQSGQPTPSSAITGMGGTVHIIVPSAGIVYRFD